MHWTSFIPLLVFSWFSRHSDIFTTGDWARAFYIGGGLALLQLALSYFKQFKLDYIAIGANLFLIYGALGYLLFKPLLTPYDLLQESVIFLAILLVGILTTIFAKDGFIQMPQLPKGKNTLWSIVLCIIAAIMHVSSYLASTHFKLDSFASVFVPFIILIFSRNLIQKNVK